MTGWFDEIDLDPAASWLRMGTRALGDRPWLVRDEHRDGELAQKAELLRSRRSDVLWSPADAAVAAADVRRLVEGSGIRPAAGIDDDLEASARVVQEDLCLLQRHDHAWHLDAACVCFPSRWRLRDKVGRPLVDVHGPTPGYGERLDQRVGSLLDRLGARPVLRRNWFVHPDPSLHQPGAPVADPVRPPNEVAGGLYLRSERQTLRALASGWILFTIRTQQAPLGSFLADPGRRDRFVRYLREAPPGDLAHRGMAAAQVEALFVHLGRPGSGGTKPDGRSGSDTTSDS